MHDLIFWWTGWAIWAIVACATAAGALIAAAVAIAQTYHTTKQWRAIWAWCHMSIEERKTFIEYTGMCTEPRVWNQFVELVNKHKSTLSKMAKGPVRDIEISAWYELSDGTIGQVVRGTWGEISPLTCYELRHEDGGLYEVRSDGVLRHNAAICLLRVTDRRPETTCSERLRISTPIGPGPAYADGSGGRGTCATCGDVGVPAAFEDGVGCPACGRVRAERAEV